MKWRKALISCSGLFLLLLNTHLTREPWDLGIVLDQPSV
jgi:hypothetical protein